MRKRDWMILALALAIALIGAFAIWRGSVMETGSWGLSFRQEGTAPVGNAGRDQLRAYDAAYLGDPSEKVLYLTFDAGYENGCTEKILDTLKKHDAKAAFFLVGSYLERNADPPPPCAAPGRRCAPNNCPPERRQLSRRA